MSARPADARSGAGLAAALPQREAGVLAHLTSLPGAPLGDGARRFVKWMADAGLSVWQTLPVTAVDGLDRSPYRALSAFAGEVSLIDPRAPSARDEAGFQRSATAAERERREVFDSQAWLDDWALFAALKEHREGQPWWLWPADLRDRDPGTLAHARRTLADGIARARYQQYVFDVQWQTLREHAHDHGVTLMGDLPILVAHDSADVWAGRPLFVLDATGQPTHVAGVPPDAFSTTGQRWGNPIYDWDRMAGDGYRWWIERMRNELSRFDIVRIDHFRGFESFWQIDAQEPTAQRGQWRPGPGRALFDALFDALGPLPVIAEDLGIITEEVRALRDALGFPGMAVLQFAFDGGDDNPYLPHRIGHNTVVYTGTHDNDTTVSWYQNLEDSQRARVDSIVGSPMPWSMVSCALESKARLAIIPMQDWLECGEGHRMNLPGTSEGNWSWTFEWGDHMGELSARVRGLLVSAGRCGRVNG